MSARKNWQRLWARAQKGRRVVIFGLRVTETWDTTGPLPVVETKPTDDVLQGVEPEVYVDEADTLPLDN